MSSPQDRKKQSQAAQPRKSSAVEQVVVTNKTQSTKPKPMTKEVVVKKAVEVASTPVAQSVAPVMVDDRPLREFLLAADLHAQQTFLAQVAVCAVKEAQNHAFAPLQDLRKQNTALVEQQQQDQQVLANHQAQHQQLLAEHAALQEQFELQQAKAHPEQNAVWIDSRTGLMWSRISIGQQWQNGEAVGDATEMNWDDAREACKQFHLAGFDDWRLPTIEELETIMIEDNSGYNAPAGMLYQPILNQLDRFGKYWSASPFAISNYVDLAWHGNFGVSSIWGGNFGSGGLRGGSSGVGGFWSRNFGYRKNKGFSNKDDNNHVRAVRASQ